MSLYSQEHQVNVVIDKYHRQAIQAEQMKLARSDRPGPIVALAMRVRASVTARMAMTRTRMQPEPAASVTPLPGLDGVIEPVAEVSPTSPTIAAPAH